MIFGLNFRVGSHLLNEYRIIWLAYMDVEKLTNILPPSKPTIKLKLHSYQQMFLQEILKPFPFHFKEDYFSFSLE